MVAEVLGVRTHRVEALEHFLARVFRDARAVIAHGQRDAFPVIVECDFDWGVGRREGNGSIEDEGGQICLLQAQKRIAYKSKLSLDPACWSSCTPT